MREYEVSNYRADRQVFFRRAAGFLFLWSILPLPFLYIVLPPFWILAALIALWRILDAEKEWRPGKLLLNFLGVIILLLVFLAGGLHVGPLRPLGHLLILLTTLKVAQINSLPDLRRVLMPVFLLQLLGLASAVHFSVLPYLLLSTVFWWYVGISVFLEGLSEELREVGLSFSSSGNSPSLSPRFRHVFSAALVSMLLGTPVFLLLPRMGSPMLALQARERESGLSTRIDLKNSGAIRQSHEAVLDIRFPAGLDVDPAWLRLRATACDMVFAGEWKAPSISAMETFGEGNKLWAEGLKESPSGIRVELTPLTQQEYLLLPSGSTALKSPESLMVDPGGGVFRREHSTVGSPYSLWFQASSPPLRESPVDRDTLIPRISERCRNLAFELKKQGRNDEERAWAIISHLQSSCRYSLDSGKISTTDPIDWFLFEGRRGHCEFFAASMVVLLRIQGIPARFVVGFHGGSYIEEESLVRVRASNAHAWVEAWMGPSRGWVVFDPTPVEGIDQLETVNLWGRILMVRQSFEDFFDRHILGFSLREQFRLLAVGDSVFWGLSDRMKTGISWSWGLLVGIPFLIFFLRRQKALPRTPARRAMFRIEKFLLQRGGELPSLRTWERVARKFAEEKPELKSEVLRLAEMAGEEAYGQGKSGNRREFVQVWKKIQREIRRGGL